MSSLDEATLSSLARDVEELSSVYNLEKRTVREGFSVFTQLAVSALPSFMALSVFEGMCLVSPVFNELYLSCVSSCPFLRIEDGFTERLIEIARRVSEGGDSFAPACEFGILRSDYMYQSQSQDSVPRLRQVEINTISSGLFTLCERVTQLHQHLLVQYEGRLPREYSSAGVVVNDSVRRLGSAFHAAYEQYPKDVPLPGAVLYVIQENEWNICDQRVMESYLTRTYGHRVVRRTLSEIAEEGRLSASGDLLLADVTVVIAYFRAGYTPRDYPTERQWCARLLLERSRCIKCPNIFLHLSGAKKVQQALAAPGVTERFLSPEKAATVRRFFAGLWSLEDASICHEAQEHPESFILKPQREGGGNNLFGGDVSEFLGALTPERRRTHILMEKLLPPPKGGFLAREGRLHAVKNLVDEYGTFAAFVATPHGFVQNEYASYLVRSKSDEADEGGVALGRAGLSSLILV